MALICTATSAVRARISGSSLTRIKTASRINDMRSAWKLGGRMIREATRPEWWTRRQLCRKMA
jgi:hypothetical protein